VGLVDLVRGPARAVSQVARVVSTAVGDSAEPDRPLATDRVSVTVPGVERPDAEALRQELCAAVGDLPGVSWAVVNAPLRRLVVGVHQPAPSHARLLATVHAVQAAHPVPTDVVHGEPEPPDDDGPAVRALTALAADAVGLAMAAVGGVVRHVPGAVEAAALVTAVDTQPAVRAVAERALGRTRADTVIAVGNALAQGLVRGFASLGVDAALRVSQLAEVRARQRAWAVRQAALFDDPRCAAAGPVVAERPRPLPDGPVERYAPRSAMLGAAAAGVALASGGGPARAAGVALATLPKAAGAGRELFATRLGRTLAGRGAHVMDRQVLRRLDRVDTVILDADALTTGRRIVTDVVALPGTDAHEAQVRVHGLFSQRAVHEVVADGLDDAILALVPQEVRA